MISFPDDKTTGHHTDQDNIIDNKAELVWKQGHDKPTTTPHNTKQKPKAVFVGDEVATQQTQNQCHPV